MNNEDDCDRLILIAIGFILTTCQSLLGMAVNRRYDCMILIYEHHQYAFTLADFPLFVLPHIFWLFFLKLTSELYDGLRELPSVCGHYCLHCSFKLQISFFALFFVILLFKLRCFLLSLFKGGTHFLICKNCRVMGKTRKKRLEYHLLIWLTDGQKQLRL